MQTNIPSSLQVDIEQVRPAAHKCNTRYYIGAIPSISAIWTTIYELT